MNSSADGLFWMGNTNLAFVVVNVEKFAFRRLASEPGECSCPDCGRTYRTRLGLNKHRRIKHRADISGQEK